MCHPTTEILEQTRVEIIKQCIFTLSHTRLKSGGQYSGYVVMALGKATATALPLQLGTAQQPMESSGEPSKKFVNWFS